MSRATPLFMVLLLGLLPCIGRCPNALAQFAEPGQRGGARPQPTGVGYTAPKSDGAVVELLDEETGPLFPLLNNDTGGEPGSVIREDRDVFTGVEAARVTPLQRYSSRIPGWGYRIVETPKNPGEFRYLRFAWKKIGGSGIMLQLHDNAKSWFHRYYAGRNAMGWAPATSVSDQLPGEWEVVTRDLFKEAGAFTLTGIALTPFDGTAGLFDHILLGRTVADLDEATKAALGKVKPTTPLTGKERDAHWADLIGLDAKKAAAALRLFLASSPDQVQFIRDRLGDTPGNDTTALIHKFIRELDSDSFDLREQATSELIKLGASVIDPLREAGMTTTSDEVRFRARIILKRLGGSTTGGLPVSKAARTARVIRVLERAGTADARKLLTEIADGKLAPEGSPDAKAAIARLPKLP